MNHRWLAALFLLGTVLPHARPGTAAAPDPEPEPVAVSSVGMPVVIRQLVLPGSLLEVRPLTSGQPLVVRLVASYAHGDAHRYDLEVYGLEAGQFDLGDSLQRSDGRMAEGLPPLLVRIVATLPAGQVLPHAVAPRRPPRLGGYRWLLIGGGLLWLAGLAWLLWGFRRSRASTSEPARPPTTVADQLRPLVQAALEHRLSPDQRVHLERLLLAFWCRKLGVQRQRPAHAMATLRAHPEAGKMIQQLETWLHCPDPTEPVDLDALLAPYQSDLTGVHPEDESVVPSRDAASIP